eukprot:m.233221 g.233221  ORF g.233221 m.233221 type:complete len:1028 (-) comp33636_c2_seq2:52-3135(-)
MRSQSTSSSAFLLWTLVIVVGETSASLATHVKLARRLADCEFNCQTNEYCGSVPDVASTTEPSKHGFPPNEVVADLSGRGITSINDEGLDCVLFNSISAFNFSNNAFEFLPAWSIFARRVNPLELSLSFNNNQITQVPPGYFLNASDNLEPADQIWHLHLNHNLIKTLQPYMLAGYVGNQLYLHLNSNEIDEIETNAFWANYSKTDPTTISTLTVELMHNNVSTLVQNVFSFLGQNLTIQLQNNMITTIENHAWLFQGGNTLNVSLDNNKIPIWEFQDLSVFYGGHLDISMKNNSMTQIAASAFQNFDSEKKLSINIDDNLISNFDSDFSGFHGQLFVLSLNNNLLTTLGGSIFSSFPTNTDFKCSFNSNHISNLSTHIFDGFQGNLLSVSLQSNGLTILETFAFEGFVGVALFVDLENNAIASLGENIFAKFQGTGIEVNLMNNNIQQVVSGFATGIGINNLHLFGNPLQCTSYVPQLSGCTCTDSGDSFFEHCGNGLCEPSSFSFCSQLGYYPTSTCPAPLSPECVDKCVNNSEYMLVSESQATCFPKTICSTAFANSNTSNTLSTTYAAAYQLINATTTSDRVCQRCTVCPLYFQTTPCTPTSDTTCTKLSHTLTSAETAAIVIFTILGVAISLALCWWGMRQKSGKEKTIRSLEQQSEELELTTQLLVVNERKVNDTEESWKIRWGDLVLGELLGKGAFGVVTQAQWLGSNVAVKVLKVDIEMLDVESSAFQREVTAMQSLHHPNLVTFYGFGTTIAGQPFLVTELMRETLRERLQENKAKGPVDWAEARRWCADIVAGMQFLHTRTPPMVHRDLKSDNCLLGENDVVKIADFGTVTRPGETLQQARSVSMVVKNTPNDHQIGHADHDHLRSTGASSLMMTATISAGTPLWMAPEMMSGKHGWSHYGLSVDVYSFAMVMYEIATRQLPFPNCDSMSQFAFNNFVIDGGRPTLPKNGDDDGDDNGDDNNDDNGDNNNDDDGSDNDGADVIPAAYVTLMKRCWEADPLERPLFIHVASTLRSMQI